MRANCPNKPRLTCHLERARKPPVKRGCVSFQVLPWSALNRKQDTRWSFTIPTACMNA